MTHGNVPEYQLAEKMKSRFSGRGSAVSGMQASPTSELVRRAQMGRDPSVNCSELSFERSREGVAGRVGGTRPSGTGTRPSQTYARPMYANSARSAGGGQSRRDTDGRTFGVGANGNGRGAAAVGGGRNANGRGDVGGTRNGNAHASTGSSAAAKTSARTAGGTSGKKKKVKQGRARSRTQQRTRMGAYSYSNEPEEISEVRVEGRRMTPLFAVFLVIGTMMIMSIVFSFSEIYRTTSEISRLENTLDELEDQAAELELKLEEKNDIRVIERIATEELGMVAEDAVQRRYISLSDGERIDVISDGGAEDRTTSGVLLSSFWSSLGGLLDYFR